MRRRVLTTVAAVILALTQTSALLAAQRQQEGTTTEPWECTQCNLCKENAKKACGDSKTCSSDCAQLCIICSQKSLTGNGTSGGSGGQSHILVAPSP